jgi:hypothetical protein
MTTEPLMWRHIWNIKPEHRDTPRIELEHEARIILANEYSSNGYFPCGIAELTWDEHQLTAIVPVREWGDHPRRQPIDCRICDHLHLGPHAAAEALGLPLRDITRHPAQKCRRDRAELIA